MKIKWFGKKVDERQEMDLLKAEHFSFWCMYYMLLASMVIQYFVLGYGVRAVAGEWVVFMLTSFILVAACIRKGVWSFGARKVPGIKAYFVYSLIAMMVVGMLLGLLYCDWEQWSVMANVEMIAVFMLQVFVASFVLFFLAGTLAKRREKRLAEEDLDVEDEEDL